jgi:hypothetical protein
MIEGCIQPRHIAFFRDAVKTLQFDGLNVLL